jgi:hypothetical protein
MQAVMECERRQGYEPLDVSEKKVGYDIESRHLNSGKIRFIEVKGRATGATSVTVTRNEILTALNEPDAYTLAIVEVEDGKAKEIRYIQKPFSTEPDFHATSVSYDLKKLVTGRS